ncbi:DUF2188 domain-containing protein [Amycolatopsis thailandensis]|uniref:DUF2188 domain-containing protein n=1 Tax=Amycolatopsis thailandensis TaxID=589330 RepID=UPI0036408128
MTRKGNRPGADDVRRSGDPSILAVSGQGMRKRVAVKGEIETDFEDGQWKNKVKGSSRAASVHDTKAEAAAKGRDMARERKVEYSSRNMDGPIGECNTYRHDPRDISG